VGNINKLSEMVKDLKSYTVHELDTMDEKILAVDAWVGRTGTSEGLKECVLAWDGITMVQGKMALISQAVTQVDAATKSLEGGLDAKVSPKMASLLAPTSQEVSTLRTSIKDITDFLTLFRQELNLLNSGFTDLRQM